MSEKPVRTRIGLLDAWRSLAIVIMVGYHFLYDLALVGRMSWKDLYSPGLNALQLFGCCSFILLCGISSRFSRSNVKRGLVTLSAGLLIMAGAYLAGRPVLFGILQFLGLSMLLYGLAGRAYERLPGLPAAAVCLVLFLLTRTWTKTTYVTARWRWPLGFRFEGFYSADYYPMLPWIFVFLIGTCLGGVILRHRDAVWLYTPVPAAVTWPGRNSLLIYLLHQPVLYSLCIWLF
jgi:uncharacterized membrane protein